MTVAVSGYEHLLRAFRIGPMRGGTTFEAQRNAGCSKVSPISFQTPIDGSDARSPQGSNLRTSGRQNQVKNVVLSLYRISRLSKTAK
jgi:hypothetical protein